MTSKRGSYCELVARHYEQVWKNRGVLRQWQRGPLARMAPEFRVLELSPTETRNSWTYATVGMSDGMEEGAVEVHLLSPVASPLHVESLTVIAHYHRTEAMLGLGHTVNLGRPWLPGSSAAHMLLSLPYLDGPELEWARVNGVDVRFLWLIPITLAERDFKAANGLEALEQAFEKAQFNYLDPRRASVV